jgi:hypothetical protein
MSWIEDTLNQIRRERARQMQGAAPPPGVNGPQPTGPVGGFPRQGPSKGLAQPEGGLFSRQPLNAMHAERQGRDVSMGAGRTSALMQAYQAYLKRSGRSQDPLLGQRPGVGGDDPSVQGAQVVRGADGEAFSVNQSQNERRGLTMQTLELPTGQRVHVYYGKNGERTVIRLPRKR